MARGTEAAAGREGRSVKSGCRLRMGARAAHEGLSTMAGRL
jgi:hypothetical protein